MDISNAQFWLREVGNRREMVFGKPRVGLWTFVVDIAGHRITRGTTGTLSIAMSLAEDYASLLLIETTGTA